MKHIMALVGMAVGILLIISYLLGILAFGLLAVGGLK